MRLRMVGCVVDPHRGAVLLGNGGELGRGKRVHAAILPANIHSINAIFVSNQFTFDIVMA